MEDGIGQRRLWQLDPERSVDAIEKIFFFRSNEGDDVSGCTGARGTAGAMDVVVGAARHIEVDNMRDTADVETASGYVGGDQDRIVAAPEGL